MKLIGYATLMLQNEQLRTKTGGSDQGPVLIKQLTGESALPAHYVSRHRLFTLFGIVWMYGEAPFQDPCSGPLHRLTWWKSRSKDSNASILAVNIFTHTLEIALLIVL